MNKSAAFDPMAPAYDREFTNSVIGKAQRGSSRRWLLDFLDGKERLNILEINCGTGEDALWLASLGHQVTATDASERMIDVAKEKALLSGAGNEVHFTVCSFENLPDLPHRDYDLVFSNFAGVNCIDHKALYKLLQDLSLLTKPQGHLALVVFGKYCCWECMYYLLKASPAKAFRRWRQEKIEIELAGRVKQPVFYHPVRRFSQNGFVVKEKRPVGLLIPPSYLETWARAQAGIFKRLLRLEMFKWPQWTATLADHTYLLLKKQA